MTTEALINDYIKKKTSIIENLLFYFLMLWTEPSAR